MSELHKRILTALILTHKDQDVVEMLKKNVDEALKLAEIEFCQICDCDSLKEINLILCQDSSVRWRFIGVLSYTLLEILKFIKANDDYMMSVNCQKSIKNSCEFIVCMGILPSLIPGVGIPLEKRSEFGYLYQSEELTPTKKYDRLKAMCNLFSKLCEVSTTKAIIYGNFLKDYLATLLQLSYAPLAKPGLSKLYDNSEFTMTDSLYSQLLNEQKQYQDILIPIFNKCYRPLLIKELLILQSIRDPAAPGFVRKIVSRELSNILIDKDGLLFTMRCFFDSPNLDVGSQWKHVDIIKRLISVKHGSLSIDDYLKNICKQLNYVLNLEGNSNFVMVAAACATYLCEKYPENESVLGVMNSLTQPLLLVDKETFTNGILLLSAIEIIKLIRTLDTCFNTPKLCMPSKFLTPIIYNLFGLRVFSNSDIKNQLDNLLLKHFSSKHFQNSEWFDIVVFKKASKGVNINENIYFDITADGVQIKYEINKGNVTVESAINCILELIEEHPSENNFGHAFYVFCLTSLMRLGKGDKIENSKELLINEDETHDLIGKESEHLLILLKALEKLTSMESVFNSFKEDPSLIIEFVISCLNEYANCLNNKIKFNNEECIVICLTLVSVLSESCANEVFISYLQRIESAIQVISEKSPKDDIKFLCSEIIILFTHNNSSKEKKETSEFEKAVNFICDPLLPTRAHGVMELTKLIQQKDPETLSKKHYVQCIFEENLKSDDSYLYLCAINGLAAMANYLPEDILDVLTREFSNESTNLKNKTDEENEKLQVRMKIGEVLVKVSKNLGDLVANHKSLLLNTFLQGCKDRDDLMRASSLSNLSEIARILSYQLGPVLYEMLNCINSILETDKSQECRRAAVMVISSLLKGLGREALYFLREALLPIYRTLKQLYSNESEDNTVRLHAQIALEELNNIVRGMIFSPIKMEKQIFVLDKPV